MGARALLEGIEVTFAPAEEGGTAPAPQVYDMVLQAVGCTPKPSRAQSLREASGVRLFAHGFSRARRDDCGYGYFVAFSCKGWGVCPSCTLPVEAAPVPRQPETKIHPGCH